MSQPRILRDSIPYRELYWLAGILEGEGSFDWHNSPRSKGSPRIQLSMTDLDIIQRVSSIFNSNVLGPYGPYTTQKKPYYFTTCGNKQGAVEWMKLLFPIMGNRRKKQILKMLERWESTQ